MPRKINDAAVETLVVIIIKEMAATRNRDMTETGCRLVSWDVSVVNINYIFN